MNMFIKMGFKNLFRNKRRTFLTCVFIGLGLTSMIIIDGFMDGMNENMIHSVTRSLVSEGQIHNPKYRESRKSEYMIKNLPEVKNILDSETEISDYAERVICFAMISSPRGNRNVALYGIDPKHEPGVSDISKQVYKGEFIKDENSLVIGYKLKKRLAVDIGDKVVITTSAPVTGEIKQAMFRISGFIKAGSDRTDEKTAFIHIKRAQRLLGINNNIHEIALRFKNRKIGESENFPLWKRLNKTGNSAESWKKIMSSFVGIMKMSDESKLIVAGILMALVALGIINTLFMALYERLFEFAVLRALGTKGSDIVMMIVSEAGAMAIFSIIAGLLLALVFAIPLAKIGVNYNGVEFADVTFKEPVYYMFALRQITVYPIVTLLFTMIIGLYPALHAARIKVGSALKRSL